MIELIWIEEKKQLEYKINTEKNFISHLFLVNNKFIISKFISTFIKYYDIDNFDYWLFTKTQLKLLENPYCWFWEDVCINISDLNIAESLAIINFIEVVQNYTKLLWITSPYNKKFFFAWNDQLIDDFINFKKFLIKDIEFLKEDLSWECYNIEKTNKKWKNILEILKNTSKRIEIQNIYKPTRPTIRFFLYHFFWTLKKEWENFKPLFSTFSEEINNTVNLATIFEPEKYINNNTYKDFDATMQEWWQYDIINAILQNKNTLWIMSTWGGKSITFLLSWMIKPGSSFIIAPLKSLIDDQYFNLEKKFNLYWITDKIHSWLNKQEKEVNIQNLQLGKNKFFYCSPERLQIRKFVDQIFHAGIENNWFTISQIIIDEAHCVSERWHDFRFSYLNIKLFNEYIQEKNIKNIPIVWLTATASDIVKKDIVSYLGIIHVVEESTLNRPNLSLEIKSNIIKSDKIPIELDNPQKKPEIIKQYLDENINKTLWHIANKNSTTIWSITQNIDDEYKNAWMIFTIYGWIGGKTSEDSITQSAEGILQYLKWNYTDSEYIKMFFSEAPDFEIAICPNCWSNDIIEGKQWKKENEFYLYYDNVDQKYITYIGNFDERRKNMCNSIKETKSFFVCNNPACKRKSFDYKDWELSKPKKEKILFNDNYDENEIKKNEARENIKTQLQNSFKENKTWLLIATKWFWMWIDKPNIRYIIHSTLSGSLESYYQEIGRAWRDRNHSHCVLLFIWPNKKCLEETHELEKSLPCLDDPECFLYQKCKTADESMCDIARQQKMMMNFVVIDIKKNEKKIKDFLHNYLHSEDMVNNPYWAELPRYFEKNIRKTLYKNISSSFSHPLIEFWQLYFFYYDIIKENLNEETIEIHITENKEWEKTMINIWWVKYIKPERYDSSWFEKMLYRLMCLGVIKRYFNEYIWHYKRIFYIDINKKLDIRESVYKYLYKMLWEDAEKDNSREDELEKYPTLEKRIKGQKDEVVKYFWILIYYIYKKLEPQKKETLRYLYLAIKDSEEKNMCFRKWLLNRLTWLSKKDDMNESWCGFCSACCNDLQFSKTKWMLKKDFEIIDMNKILKKHFIWEILTKEEEKKLDMYSEKIRIESTIRNLFEEIKTIWDAVKTIDIANKNKYTITWLIQKKIESWTNTAWYYLLSAYYELHLREERIKQFLDIVIKEKDEQWLFEIGKRLADWKDENKKDLIQKINENTETNTLKRFFEIWMISRKINAEDFEKIAIIAKAYDSFTSLNK